MKLTIILVIILASSLIINLDAYYFCKKASTVKYCRIPCDIHICSNDEFACSILNEYKNYEKDFAIRLKHELYTQFMNKIKDCKSYDYNGLSKFKKKKSYFRYFIG